MATLRLYDRMENEGDKPFEAFKIYLAIGPGRTLRQVYEQLKKDPSLIERWSSKWKWAIRVAAWDKEREDEIFEELAKEVKKANLRHIKLAQKLQDLGIDRLPTSELQKNGKKKGIVPVSEARLLITTGIDIERKALGIAEKVKVDHTSNGKRITGMIVEYVDTKKPGPPKSPKPDKKKND